MQATIKFSEGIVLERMNTVEGKKRAPLNLQTVIDLKGKLVSVLKRSPEPVIALSAIFEALGYTGLTGIGWGVLAGFIVSVAVELGYEVRKIGGRYILFRYSRGDKG